MKDSKELRLFSEKSANKKEETILQKIAFKATSMTVDELNEGYRSQETEGAKIKYLASLGEYPEAAKKHFYSLTNKHDRLLFLDRLLQYYTGILTNATGQSKIVKTLINLGVQAIKESLTEPNRR